MFENKSILVLDIETDSVDIETARMKWFGAYSYLHNEYYMLEFPKDRKEIISLLKDHKVHVGFNTKEFDNPIISNNLNLNENIFEYKVIIDLLEISAPKQGFTLKMSYRKNRLAAMGIKLKSFKLKSIIEALKLDKDIGTKGDIDYKIFAKDEWTAEERADIIKYLKQDIELTKILFEWYENQFSPVKRLLPQKAQDNFLYIKTSLPVLAYNIICHKAGREPIFGEKTSDRRSYEGGHHIENRVKLAKGNIIEVDFTSAYPHAIMMGNLHSPVNEGEDGWDGDEYYKIKGKYNKIEQGKVELALKEIFLERLKAKKEGDKPKDKSFKICINSFYGASANPVFKSIYSRNAASDCTSIVRTWMKKLAKTLTENGYECLYGFTDSIFILIPPNLNKAHALCVIDEFIKEAVAHMPFPMDTFKMGIEEEIKMIWFVAKNCYLFVTNKDEIKYKSTLLNTNTPPAVMKLFETYMKPVIIKNLEIPFTKKELQEQLKIVLEKEPELGAQEYNVSSLDSYKVTTSLQYRISKQYGTGRHKLIPNRKGVGLPMGKDTKREAAMRLCTIEEFKEKNLNAGDIDLKHLTSHLRPFYEHNEIEYGDGYVQTVL
jgi:DNA polymerase elongation subunit (family B)